jgi:UDP-2,3-diacylglucosamine hydrolase
VRARVRTRQWQESFLAKSPEQRIAFARDVRQESADYKQAASEEIMDVNPDTVAEAFARHGVDRMIHGHTHRPAIHDLYLENSAAQRIVLGDWYTQGSVLRVTHADAQLESLENPG